MTIVDLETDNIQLIRQRLADDGINFPTLKDFLDNTETARPDLFNFFSFHGRFVFMRFSRGNYEVICRNFSVGAVLGVNPISENKHSGNVLIQRTPIRELAFGWFKNACKKVIEVYG